MDCVLVHIHWVRKEDDQKPRHGSTKNDLEEHQNSIATYEESSGVNGH